MRACETLAPGSRRASTPARTSHVRLERRSSNSNPGHFQRLPRVRLASGRRSPALARPPARRSRRASPSRPPRRASRRADPARARCPSASSRRERPRPRCALKPTPANRLAASSNCKPGDVRHLRVARNHPRRKHHECDEQIGIEKAADDRDRIRQRAAQAGPNRHTALSAAARRTHRRYRALRQHAEQPVVEHRAGTAPSGGGSSRQSGCSLRKRSICSSFSSGSSEQVLYTSRPPGRTTLGGRAQNGALHRRHHREVRHLEAPARVGMPAERSGARARRVDEHDVDRRDRRKARVGDVRVQRVDLQTLARSRRTRCRRANDRSLANTCRALRDSSTDFPPGAAQRSATTRPVGTHAYCVTSVDAGSCR